MERDNNEESEESPSSYKVQEDPTPQITNILTVSTNDGDIQPSTVTTASQLAVRSPQASMNVQDLSFILHPAHDATSTEKVSSPVTLSHRTGSGKTMAFARTSYALGVCSDEIEKA